MATVKKTNPLVQKLKLIRFFAFLWVKKWEARLFSQEYKNIKKTLRRKSQGTDPSSDMPSLATLRDRLFLLSSFRLNSPLRHDIFRLTSSISLAGVKGTGLTFKVADASTPEYTAANKTHLEQFGLDLRYEAEALNFQKSLIKIHSNNKQKYFAMIYDDQPIVGMTPDFLNACTALLDDFKDSVHMVLIESPQRYEYPQPYVIDRDKKTIAWSPDNLEFRDKGQKPIGIVKYGDYSFAIIFNYHYGFFFNTIIANSKDYSDRLKWYMDYVKSDNAQYIELAGMKRKGPVFKYLAVSLDAAMFNADCAATEIAIRPQAASPKDMYEALRDGCVFTRKGR